MQNKSSFNQSVHVITIFKKTEKLPSSKNSSDLGSYQDNNVYQEFRSCETPLSRQLGYDDRVKGLMEQRLILHEVKGLLWRLTNENSTQRDDTE